VAKSRATPELQLIRVSSANLAFNPAAKAKFHRLGKKVLASLAELLNLPQGTYSIRSCLGGPAVAGEIILHADTFYLQLCQGLEQQFMWRTCRGQQDFSGGTNRWVRWSQLADLAALAASIRKVTATTAVV
jgi:hypothetical protein